MNAAALHRILVADDDDNIRLIVAETVRSQGFEVIEASDGLVAMDLALNDGIDLAILDISMPGHTGLEVCTALKKSEVGELVPVILLTAKDTLDDKVLGLESGADEYLTKPFQYKELQARVKACLRTRELNCKLRDQSRELQALQDALLAKERQIVAGQIGGAAAHAMGQPLASMLLNMFLLETLPKEDERFVHALKAMKGDCERLKELLEKIRSTDASQKETYHGSTEILSLSKK